jgi:hypothetical protein
MYCGEDSPFQLWWNIHMRQIGVSPDIRKLLAEAFEGGQQATPQKYCPSENNEAYEKGFIDGMAKQRESSVDKWVRGEK